MTAGRQRELTPTEHDDSCHRFEAFYGEFLPRVRAFARKLVHDRHGLDDVVQETFMRAYHAGIHLEDSDESDPWPWLATVTRNIALDLHRRTRGIVQDPFDEEVVEVDVRRDDPAVVVMAHHRRNGVSEALEGVCDRQRRILVMKHVEGRRYEEIAAVEGITVDALKSVLARARRAFRDSYAVVTQRQGFGALVGGGMVVRMRSKMRAVRGQAGSMGESMSQAFATAPAAFNSAVTALALGTAAVTGVALASDGPHHGAPAERPALAAALTAPEPAAPPARPVYADVARPVDTQESAESMATGSPAAAQAAPSDPPPTTGPLADPVEVDSGNALPVSDAPAGGGVEHSTSSSEGDEVQSWSAANLDADGDGEPDAVAGVPVKADVCLDPGSRGPVTSLACPILGA